MANFMASHLFSFMQGIFTVATSSVIIISAAATLNQVKVLAHFQLLLLLLFLLLSSCSACRMRCSMQMSPDMQISVSLAGDVVVVVVVMCAYDLTEPSGGARPARQADWQREASVWVVPKRLACFISLTQPAASRSCCCSVAACNKFISGILKDPLLPGNHKSGHHYVMFCQVAYSYVYVFFYKYSKVKVPYTSPAYSSFFFPIIDVRAFADPEARTLRQDRDASSIPVVIDSVCFAHSSSAAELLNQFCR